MADTYDLLTLPEAKSVLRISGQDSTQDGDLARVVTAISRRLDSAIGPTVARAVTSERHRGGRFDVELFYGPVLAVGSVLEYQGTLSVTLTEVTPGVEPTDGWYGERYSPQPTLYSGVIVRRLGAFTTYFWDGPASVAVTYTAGRTTSTAGVDPRIKEGAAVMLKNWWRAYEQSAGQFDEFNVPVSNFPTFAIPAATREILRDVWQPETGFGFGG